MLVHRLGDRLRVQRARCQQPGRCARVAERGADSRHIGRELKSIRLRLIGSLSGNRPVFTGVTIRTLLLLRDQVGRRTADVRQPRYLLAAGDYRTQTGFDLVENTRIVFGLDAGWIVRFACIIRWSADRLPRSESETGSQLSNGPGIGLLMTQLPYTSHSLRIERLDYFRLLLRTTGGLVSVVLSFRADIAS